MLSHLEIRNLALIKEADLDFAKGLTCIIGETGTGKSLLLSAIKLLLGGKNQSALLAKTGNLSVSGEFIELNKYLPVHKIRELALAEAEELIDNSDSAELKEEQEPELELNTEAVIDSLVVRRVLTTGNRSRTYVNNRLVTLDYLQQLAQYLGDIHSQNEQQQLFKVSKHIEYLDAYAGAECLKLKGELHQEYLRLLQKKRRLNKLIADPKKRELALRRMQAQLAELQKANLQQGEFEQLLLKRKKYSQLSELVTHLEKAQAILNLAHLNQEGLSYSNGISSELAACIRELEFANKISSKMGKLSGQAENLLERFADFEAELQHVLQALPLDANEIAKLEARYDLLCNLQQKYTSAGTYDDLLAYVAKLSAKIKLLEDTEIERVKLVDEIATLTANLQAKTTKLHDLRVRAAAALSKEMAAVCADLSLPNINFQVEIADLGFAALSASGCDKVEFFMSANLGQDPKPLAKIASGGESSRLFLALKVIFAKIYQVPLLIFDEIDQGLSGAAAEQVALKLAELGREHQVICISHQAQIIAHATNIIKLTKYNDHVREVTETKVQELTEEEILTEIMRLLGAKLDDPAAYDLAKNLRQKIKF